MVDASGIGLRIALSLNQVSVFHEQLSMLRGFPKELNNPNRHEIVQLAGEVSVQRFSGYH